MLILRQGLSFGLVGALQLLLDWAVFVLTSWAGLPTQLANLVGRIAGASLGFRLNGSLTFRREGASTATPHALRRFVIAWLLLTVVSIATKYLTAAIITRDLTSYRGSTRRAGALLAARGEFSVVVAGIASTSAVAPASLPALAAAYVLLTAIVGPIVARFSPRPSRRLVPRGSAAGASSIACSSR